MIGHIANGFSARRPELDSGSNHPPRECAVLSWNGSLGVSCTTSGALLTNSVWARLNGLRHPLRECAYARFKQKWILLLNNRTTIWGEGRATPSSSSCTEFMIYAPHLRRPELGSGSRIPLFYNRTTNRGDQSSLKQLASPNCTKMLSRSITH